MRISRSVWTGRKAKEMHKNALHAWKLRFTRAWKSRAPKLGIFTLVIVTTKKKVPVCILSALLTKKQNALFESHESFAHSVTDEGHFLWKVFDPGFVQVERKTSSGICHKRLDTILNRGTSRGRGVVFSVGEWYKSKAFFSKEGFFPSCSRFLRVGGESSFHLKVT